MSYLSTIKLGNASYDIKDQTARDGNPYSLETTYTTTAIGLSLVANDTSAISNSINAATTTTAGLMSASDKANLNNKPNVVELNNYISAGKIIPSWNSVFARGAKPVNVFYFKTGTNVPSEIPTNTEIVVFASTQMYDVSDYSYGRYYSYAVYDASTRAFLANYTRYTVPAIILEVTGEFEATTTKRGLMSASDKTNLNYLTNNAIVDVQISDSAGNIGMQVGLFSKTGGDDPIVENYFPYANRNNGGFIRRVDVDILQGEDVKIVYHTKTSSVPQMYTTEGWKLFSSQNDVTADGVFLSCGGKNIIIAKDQYNLKWSSSDVLTNSSLSRRLALLDFDGLMNTYKIVNNATLSGDSTSSYGAKKCNSYTTENSAGFGILAGSWYLPSAGEMMMILANSPKLNKALNEIGGTEIDRYSDKRYMTSTEVSSFYYHAISSTYKVMYQPRKSTEYCWVLPIAQISY